MLVWATDSAYSAERLVLGALASGARILVYGTWFVAVWRCSRNVQQRFWTYAARTLAIAGLVASAVLY